MQSSPGQEISTQNNQKKRLFLIDGYGFVFRAFHALPPIRTSRGVPTGAVFGFVNMLTKLRSKMEADDSDSYMVIVFDAGKKTFRDDIYTEYKANRQLPPDDLVAQFPLIRRAAEAMNVPAVELENYEADDLIATYTKHARADGIEVTIVSSDKDLMQLISEGVKMFDPVKAADIGEKEVFAKFGVKPEKVADVLALIGDSSDNVPGVRGIGPKTAAELIGEYGSLENLLENIDKIKQEKRAAMLRDNIENARMSKQLVLLHYEVPLPSAIENFRYRPADTEKMIEFFKEMEFKTLLTRLEKSLGLIAPAPVIKQQPDEAISDHTIYDESKFYPAKDIKDLKEWLAKARIQNQISIYIEKTKDSYGIIIGYADNQNKYTSLYIDLINQPTGQMGFDLLQEETKPISLNEILLEMKPLLENPAILKTSHNTKDLYLICSRLGINIAPIEDIMLMSNVLDSTLHRHDIETIAKLNLETDISDGNKTSSLYKKSKAIYDARIILKRRLFLEKMQRVYELLERPLIEVLGEMEKAGILVDKNELIRLSEYFESELQRLEAKIFNISGHEFNIGSPKQLSEVLFGEMGFAGGKKLKTGAYTTGASALETLAEQGQEIALDILQWRQFSKLKSTYSDALRNEINPADGRVHTTYLMASTSTGRLSSTAPNLQNIPIKSEEGRKIRRAFIAAPAHQLITADYSQVELRLLAHMADMPILKEAFKKGEDIHNLTASQVFGVAPDKVDNNIRRMAKTINFGIIYGQSGFGLAKQLGIPVGQASQYIKAYFEKYPGILEYMEKTKEFARENGFVVTLFGRKCHVLGMNDRNQGIRGNAERAAINAPLQGTAADIIKRAMIQLHSEFSEKNYRTKMLLQVHDELIFEAPDEEIAMVTPAIKKIMENAITLSVPLIVDIKTGGNWGEVKP